MYERFVLLDRDGVLNEHPDSGYVTSPEMLDLVPGAGEAVADLNRNGFGALVISNQQCVGKGLLTWEGLRAVSEALRGLVVPYGGDIVDWYYCPHLVAEQCACRKPQPGLILKAREDYGFVLDETYFVGDAYNDLEAARLAGCRSVFVTSGIDAPRYERGEPFPYEPDFVASDLAQAARFIIQQSP